MSQSEFEVSTMCFDCKVDVFSIAQYAYMLHDSVWEEAVKSEPISLLCIACLEVRLGRELVPEDFKPHVLINKTPSPVLVYRQGHIDESGVLKAFTVKELHAYTPEYPLQKLKMDILGSRTWRIPVRAMLGGGENANKHAAEQEGKNFKRKLEKSR